ncbi:Trk system potassium transporter TrkA [Paracoccus sp. (in: a-proteobacteria)]|uniref:Trk system potassium transporter TrkA n=1 Tax=Paracoccus sp. TaxID=267 RepID=UPI0026DFF5DB|nr:Trk system potassium transporter TrkA [Paracoccus sp. (in: a-proteobacteria)]MDO5369440.1 Trk system potassium transporter TrkA [Paracoccus sp. (in: a-proteobacteria)]
MRIIICGAGQVGWQIARQLSGERHDVVLIDRDERLIQQVNDALDVQGIAGHASHPDVLDRAGAADCDLLIAATASDEVNIVSCEIAAALFSVPRRIARLRAPAYMRPEYADLYQAQNLSIDVVISPEQEVAAAALSRLDAPTTFDTETFMDGRVRLLAMALTDNCPILNSPLRHLDQTFWGLRAVVVGLRRGGRFFAPEPYDQLHAGDRAYVVTPEEDVARTLDIFGLPARPIRRVVLIGAGNIGRAVARVLDDSPEVTLRLIEADRERAEVAAERLRRAVVLHGDGMSIDLMAEAGVPKADAVLTLTANDHVNILAAVRARQAGAGMVVALINDPSLLTLASSLGIDAQISPRAVSVSSILRHIRRGRVRDVYALGDAEAELIEAQVLPGSPLAGQAVRDLELPKGALIAAIEKPGALLKPRPDTRMDPGDLVLIFALSGDIEEVERLLQVSADWF